MVAWVKSCLGLKAVNSHKCKTFYENQRSFSYS
ncbi:hypothetical protein TSAR_003400 [Trichomalopsis sarcophagae]|uniref:Uncharacterized protein n=1 Tax=Trichomalopsis sarcophagae TaxID=543379 RepID=A0A232EV59_9HYME|nr:hypothetical protein TSAR_003400 [Trichomalopsis sarcophagae]